MLQFMGSQRVGHDCVTKLNRTENVYTFYFGCTLLNFGKNASKIFNKLLRN